MAKQKKNQTQNKQAKTEVVEHDLTVTAVERVGDRVLLHLKGSLTVLPSNEEKGVYLGMQVGSRISVKKFDL